MASFNLPPRQKMINLIYIVLLAMMAINVSSDVMQGFTVLTLNSREQNRTLREMNERLTALCRQSGIEGPLPAPRRRSAPAPTASESASQDGPTRTTTNRAASSRLKT